MCRCWGNACYRSGYSGAPTGPLNTAHYSENPPSLADSGTPRWLLGSRHHGHNHTPSGSLAQTCPSGTVGRSAAPSNRLCRHRIHLQDYILPRWRNGRWRCILGPTSPQSKGWSSAAPASPLCRSKPRQLPSSQQSFHRSTPGSSSCHRCHSYMDSHSEPPYTRGYSGIFRWRYHTPLHSHTDTAPGSHDHRNRERTSHYRRVLPSLADMCILLSWGGS